MKIFYLRGSYLRKIKDTLFGTRITPCLENGANIASVSGLSDGEVVLVQRNYQF